MDASKLILTENVSLPTPLKDLNKTSLHKKINSASEDEKKQIAKDFESIFIDKLLNEMKDSIGEWGFEKDAASRQVQGIFWMYLARDIANKGGFGLWKDMYQLLTDAEQTNTAVESLDSNA